MLRLKQLGQDEPPPEEVTIPGTPTGPTVEAIDAAKRKRIMLVGGVALLGVVVVGALALIGLTAEKRTHVDRHPLRAGQHRCVGHIKYRVVNDYGRLQKIGTC